MRQFSVQLPSSHSNCHARPLRGLCWLVACLLLAAAGVPALAAEADAAKEKHFEEKIRPVLAERCFKCHGDEKQESDLRVDSRAGITQGGATGEKLINSENPKESLLIKALQYEGDLQMPPDAKLSEEQINDFLKWIEQGYVWPNSPEGLLPLSAAQRVVVHQKEHWAYQPVTRPLSAHADPAAHCRSPLDELLVANLTAQSLTFAPEADRQTLLRRLSFDLIGLPPSYEEVQAFNEDMSPDAYERQVDRLLASPQFGERWARHWLDVARYADTKGYAFQKDRRYPYAYTYRDYVVRAFNDDLPYDDFITQQLAADHLDLKDDMRPLAAMGFLTVGRKFNNGQDDIDDKIDVVSRGLLGLTVACARCHDHKYDAVPTEDYYSLYGVFASSQEPEELPIIGPPAAGDADQETFEAELAKRKQAVADFERERRTAIIAKLRSQVVDYLMQVVALPPGQDAKKILPISIGQEELKPKLLDAWRKYLKSNAQANDPTWGLWQELTLLSREVFDEQAPAILQRWSEKSQGLGEGQVNPLVKAAFSQTPPKSQASVARLYGNLLTQALKDWQGAGGNAEAFDKLPPETRLLAQAIAGPGTPTDIPEGDWRFYFTRADTNKQRDLQKKVDSFTASSAAAPPRAMVLKANEHPHNPHVFIRGQAGRNGKLVPRQVPAVISLEQRHPFATGGRLELAQAIVSKENPLTARVIVNRLWMHHFGQPLVSTPSDFGIRTEPPLQQKALDWLAFELMDDQVDWSLKQIHRLLVTSQAYRQSSLDRPDCRAVDPENRLYWRMNRMRLEFEPLRDSLLAVSGQLDTKQMGRSIDLFKAPYTTRRSIYGIIDRQDLPNTFRIFDLASPDQSSPKRPETSVPQQSLFLMNSPFVQQAAAALAKRVQDEPNADQRIRQMYQFAFARLPDEHELQVGRDYVAQANQPAEAPAEKDKVDAWTQYAQLLLLTNEFTYID